MWNAFPTASRQPADVVLGQDGFDVSVVVSGSVTARKLEYVVRVPFGPDSLLVVDRSVDRVLIYDAQG